MRRLRWRWFWLPWLLQATQPAGLEPAGAQTGEAQIGMVRSGGGQLEGGQLEAAAEEANCARVSQLVEANAEPAMLELERLARQRFGRGFSDLTPEQLIQITRLSKVEGRQASDSGRSRPRSPGESELAVVGVDGAPPVERSEGAPSGTGVAAASTFCMRISKSRSHASNSSSMRCTRSSVCPNRSSIAVTFASTFACHFQSHIL